jgi:hypothetical protein
MTLSIGRLNMLRGLPQRAGEPGAQQAFMRFGMNVRPAMKNMERLVASG